MIQKTFNRILIEFSLNPTKAKQCLSDKRLTSTEKKIIEGHLLIRNNQNQEALNIIRALPPSELAFVEGQRKLIMGLALNNLSYFTEAEVLIKDSLNIFKSLNVPYFEFVGNYYLFTIYSNRNQINLMGHTINILESIPLISDQQIIKLLRCQFDYLAQIDHAGARQILAQIELKKDEMSEGDIISHLVCEFMFYVQTEELDKCEVVLNGMKKYRKFNLTENFNFMKKLLAHLKNNEPIYLYGDDFKSFPMLNFQLKVIHSLEEKNIDEARKSWDKLHNLYPETYLSEFEFTGAKCLFSLCLDKHRVAHKEVMPIGKSESATLLDSLVELLSNSQSPLTKGHIYEHLWTETPDNKDDMKKLTRLISRARSERGIEIQSRKGTYFIENKLKKINAG